MRGRGSALCALVALVLALQACDEATTPMPTRRTLGWPASEALETLRDHLHAEGSGAEVRELFPDLEQVYVDDGHGKPFLAAILPITYYWSPSGGFTAGICNIDKTLFICPYRVSSLITEGEFLRCDVSDYYVQTEGAP